MKKTFIFICCLLLTSSLLSQSKFSLVRIIPTFAGVPLVLHQTYTLQGDSIEISKLRFYISDISLWSAGKEVWTEQNSYHLIDLEQPSSLALSLKNGLDFDEIRFQLGIDSATNVSGAMGGDLDPTKGMYWAWNTGYINFKLEGRSGLVESASGSFTYHLGGYLPPYPSVQWVKLPCNPSKEQLIQFDLGSFLQAADIANQPRLMSPGEPVVKLSAIAASLFKIVENE